jgi:hypothetical protein
MTAGFRARIMAGITTGLRGAGAPLEPYRLTSVQFVPMMNTYGTNVSVDQRAGMGDRGAGKIEKFPQKFPF